MSSGTCIREQGLPANRSGLTCWQIVSQTFVAFIQSGMLRHFADDSMCVTGGCAQTALTGSSGNGYTNNRVFASSSDNQTVAGAQNASTGNAANQYKIGRYVDITNTSGQGIYGATNTLMTGNQLNNEFRPYYTVQNGYMIWHDYAVIKLNYLFESLNKILNSVYGSIQEQLILLLEMLILRISHIF